ncbi:MAG: hypothetical protein GY737_30425 [Desulfobacteraceae bacterium]|nr:hypothetical protein [Desulfobacteraceae bacterium]
MKRFLIVISLVLLIVGMAGSASAVMFNGHDYQVISYLHQSWDNATADMIADLGSDYHLATITSAAEQAFIVSLISGGEYWLGGYQMPISEPMPEAGWWWVNGEGQFWNNGSTGMYTNWNGGEPNDAYGAGSEQHLAMWGSNWKWNDEGNLNNITGYIAEKDSIPEPAGLIFLGIGIAGFARFGRKRFNNR